VTYARNEQAAAAARGDEALGLAAELSDRARREAETARRIAAMLAAQPAASDVGAPPVRPEDHRLVIGCRTCDVAMSPPLRDPDEGARVARSFFDRHGECLTYVDLEPIRRLL
jgi:hypothetical protein